MSEVTQPLSEVFSLGNGDVLDFVLCAEGLNELKILSFRAVFSNDNEQGLLGFDDSENFVQSLGDGVLAEGALDDLSQGLVEGLV